MKPRARAYSPRSRLQVLGGVLGACALVVVARAAQMQLVDRDFYQRAGDARFLRELPIATSRGMITDRNGEPLAVSSPVESIWANPKELLQHPEQLPVLAEALGIPQEVLTQRIAQRAEKEFVFLRRHINPDEAKAVVSRGIPGVYAQREFRRFYPHGEVMAHVLGFTNIDDRGQEGLELAFDDWLTGKPGAQRVIRDRRGRIVEHVDLLRAAEPGKDITLSIDRRIQYLAYRELTAATVPTAYSAVDIPRSSATTLANAFVMMTPYPNSPAGVSAALPADAAVRRRPTIGPSTGRVNQRWYICGYRDPRGSRANPGHPPTLQLGGSSSGSTMRSSCSRRSGRDSTRSSTAAP